MLLSSLSLSLVIHSVKLADSMQNAIESGMIHFRSGFIKDETTIKDVLLNIMNEIYFFFFIKPGFIFIPPMQLLRQKYICRRLICHSDIMQEVAIDV